MAGSDIERMGIESIHSFDAKSYECRIEFLGVRFDIVSTASLFDSMRIKCGVSRSTRESTRVHFIRHRIERHQALDRKSIDSVEQGYAMYGNMAGGRFSVMD